MGATIEQKTKEIEVFSELEGAAKRSAKNSQALAEKVGHELNTAIRNKRSVEAEIPPIADAAQRYVQQILDLEAKLKDAGAEIETHRKQAAVNLERAVAAEKINTGHDQVVATLEDVAELAKAHNSNASAMEKKMATRLHEAEKKLPSLEQEVGAYKSQVDRIVAELERFKEKAPKREEEIARLQHELEISKAETVEWRSKVAGIEAKIPPLSEQLMFVRAQLNEEEALKREMVKQLHASRKSETEAEQHVKELTKHVNILVEQLKTEGSEPRSPKHIDSPKYGGALSRVKASLKSSPEKMAVRALMKESRSLPAIK